MENIFPCLSCSNEIQFNDEEKVIHCSKCNSEYDITTIKEHKHLNNQNSDKLTWEKYEEKSGSGDWTTDEKIMVSSFVCHHCGSEIMTSNNTSIDKCPFCYFELSALGTLDGTFRPDLIIPFSHNKDIAKKTFASFFAKKKLLPKCFKSDENLENIVGVYIPVWLYDCKLSGKLNFEALKENTAKDGSQTPGITSHYGVIRDGELDFKKIPSCASKKVDDITLEALEPFDYDKCEKFDIDYLEGFIAEQYDVEPTEMQEVITHILTDNFSTELKKTFRAYTSSSLMYKSFSSSNAQINYGLIPVWILSTRYKGRKYTVISNGQNYKFTGVMPVDKIKQFLYFISISASFSALLLFLAIFF